MRWLGHCVLHPLTGRYVYELSGSYAIVLVKVKIRGINEKIHIWINIHNYYCQFCCFIELGC
ncbi:hypothetical protein IFVP69_C1150029 [Vibrio parahaemolyticus]